MSSATIWNSLIKKSVQEVIKNLIDVIFGLPCVILTGTELSGHWRLFVLVFLYFVVSGYVCLIKLTAFGF